MTQSTRKVESFLKPVQMLLISSQQILKENLLLFIGYRIFDQLTIAILALLTELTDN